MNKGLIVLASHIIKSKKIRTLAISVSIMLTAILFITVGGITSCIYQSLEISKQLATGSNFHAVIDEVPISKKKEIEEHRLVKNSYVVNHLGQATIGSTKTDEYCEIYSCSDSTILNHMFMNIIEGSYPVNDSQILIDEEYLLKHNIPLNVGSEIYLYNIYSEETRYILSGYYQSTADNTATRPAFTISNDDKETTIYLLLNNPINIEGKIKKIISDVQLVPNYQVNEAFNLAKTHFFNVQSVSIIIFVFLVILSCGFLAIYNIYYIALTGEIKFYGLLETLGTTTKQLKKLVFYQVTMIYCFSFPIGLLLGYFIGWKIISPIFMSLSGKEYIYSFHFSIFIFTVLFTYLTIIISAILPIKRITNMSCISALNEEGIKNCNNSRILMKDRISLWYFAIKNLKRNLKKAIISIISIAISIILFLFTMSMANILLEDSRVQTYDFCIDELKELIDIKKEIHLLLERDLENIQQIPGIKAVIPIYTKKISKGVEDIIIYGIPNEAIEKFKTQWFIGKFDKELFKTGTNAIIYKYEKTSENTTFDTENNIIELDMLKNPYGIQAFEKGNRPILSNFTILNFYSIYDYALYIPFDQFNHEFSDYHIESINIQAEKGYEDIILRQLKSMFDSNIQIRDRREQLSELSERLMALKVTGYSMSVILAFIGILNYLNVTICSLYERRREFALLNIVGMTQKQIFLCLLLECLYYVILAVMISILFGTICFKIIYLIIGMDVKMQFSSIIGMGLILFLTTIFTNFLVYFRMKKILPIEALRSC